MSIAALVAVIGLAGCGRDQAPQLDPAPDAPVTTSAGLPACPAGGPDATTPAPGCLDPEGRVIRSGG